MVDIRRRHNPMVDLLKFTTNKKIMRKVVDLYKRFIVELLWAWIGNPYTEKELDNLIRAQNHSVLFLAKTLTDEARLDCILYNINFDQKWEVPRYGRGGGLVLYWKNSINLTVEDSHMYFIDTTINKNFDTRNQTHLDDIRHGASSGV